ncbi:MAG: GYD domain-containing protein [Abditibacteriales bacterium]|nr:GYD domain-containing protein [Abditibacteriales bacterium]MDW8364309.1 GYD domain-containing protein [Abditibacteriales bacterium]
MMPTYVVLLNWTDQGVRNVKDTVARAQAFQATASQQGVQVKALYWTMGAYDGVIVLEAADEETAGAVLLSVAALGNVRAQTLRAFDADEMTRMIGKMP